MPSAVSLAPLALRRTSRVRSKADEAEEAPGLSALGGGGHTLGPRQGAGRPLALAGGALGGAAAGLGLAAATGAVSLAGLLPRTLVGGGGAATTFACTAGIALGASVGGEADTTHAFGFVAGVALAPSPSSDFLF